MCLIKFPYRAAFRVIVSFILRVVIKEYIYNVASLTVRITGEHFEPIHYRAKNIIN
jgi:hypothetical protein